MRPVSFERHMPASMFASDRIGNPVNLLDGIYDRLELMGLSSPLWNSSLEIATLLRDSRWLKAGLF